MNARDAFARVDLFEDLPAERLDELAAAAVELKLKPGDVLIKEGERPVNFQVLAEGKVEWARPSKGVGETFQTHDARGENVSYAGAMALISETPVWATGTAVTPCQYWVISGDLFVRTVRECDSAFKKIVALYSPNIQRFEHAMAQRQRLQSLGALAAGLAHEINNPAAAAKRDAAELIHLVKDLVGDVQKPTGEPPTGLALSDREEELGEKLEDAGVPDAWAIAGSLAAAGADADWIDEIGAENVPRVATCLAAKALAVELHDSIMRISELVGAMRSYSRLDQAEEQDVDIREGLKTTLIMLKHKKRDYDVQVEFDAADDLPKVPGRPLELNQVWTNLIVNALQAAPGGKVVVRAEKHPKGVKVSVEDNGTGIPEDVLPRIFEPFFTTKDVGTGTGLGLDVSRRIVESVHKGHITVSSEPGHTVFDVVLPA